MERMIEVGFRMKGGGMKRKTKTGNHWESFTSGGESEGSEETERSGGHGIEDMTEVLENVFKKAKMEGVPMYEMIETLNTGAGRDAALVYESRMPKEISKGTGQGSSGVL